MSQYAEIEIVNASGDVLAASIGETEEAAQDIGREIADLIEHQPPDTMFTFRVKGRTA